MKEWNITKIIIETIYDECHIRYTNIYEAIGCSEQTGLNYRNGKTKPTKTYIPPICQGVNKLLNNEQKKLCIESWKKIFGGTNTVVNEQLEKKTDIESFLGYLYNSFESDQKKDDMYALLNVKANSKFLQDIFIQKMIEYTRSFPNFYVRNIEPILLKIGKVEEFEKHMGMQNCFLLELRTNKADEPYNILVNFNYLWSSVNEKSVVEILEISETLMEAGIKMSLLFTNKKISEQDVAFCIDKNFYIEQIQKHELHENQGIGNYVFSKDKNKYERVANIYSDVVFEHIKKYFQVAYKNIIFTGMTEIDKRYPFVLWQAKYATRHHINFQKERISEAIENNIHNKSEQETCSNKVVGMAIGFWGFSSILAKQEMFSDIYLFDNSLEVINKYKKLIRSDSSLKGKVHCIVFTTMLFNFITKRHELYNTVDFILIGTGAGSFCRNIHIYLQMCNQWLKPNGILYASFINKEFPCMYVDRKTQEENFEYIPQEGKKIIQAVPANLAEEYEMFGVVYECNELKNMVQNYFHILSLYSYPLTSILQSTHKNQLQNILKEYDKVYSREGFSEKNFSNSKGYYIDILLQKKIGKKIISKKIELTQTIKEIELYNLSQKDIFFCKTLLIKEIIKVPNELVAQTIIIVMPSEKKLPESENKEIILGNKKFRLMNIIEINELGLEYKNISPFNVSNLTCNVKRYFDEILENMPEKEVVVYNGSFDKGYRLKCGDLIQKLRQYKYESITI